MGYKVFRKFEMNEFLCLKANLVRKFNINAFFIMIYIPVANFGTHPLIFFQIPIKAIINFIVQSKSLDLANVSIPFSNGAQHW